MKKNEIGSSGIFISELTLGCMSLPKDKGAAKDIIHTAIDNGINHLDTADLYDFGFNETMIGEIIKDFRQDIIITSKGGNHFNKDTKDWFWDPSKRYIEEAAKQSLKRLQTDYIDFYMLHGGTIEDPIDETIEAMENLKKNGLIRAYGISSIRPNVIFEYVNKSSIDGIMMQYSLLDRRPEEILSYLEEKGISVLARGPLAKGMLSNDNINQLERKGENGFLDYNKVELKNTIKELHAYNDVVGSMNELSLKYVLNQPAVISAVFGASSVEQVKENAKINLSKALPEDIVNELQKKTKKNLYEQHR